MSKTEGTFFLLLSGSKVLSYFKRNALGKEEEENTCSEFICINFSPGRKKRRVGRKRKRHIGILGKPLQEESSSLFPVSLSRLSHPGMNLAEKAFIFGLMMSQNEGPPHYINVSSSSVGWTFSPLPMPFVSKWNLDRASNERGRHRKTLWNDVISGMRRERL